ncbi:hypothetical protein [Brevundimonas diminuta]|uniref:hypothetical protein n=1 Tax=Brevundimonas diminuta TaxID=293 RepID=UPI0030F5ECAE
MAAALPQGAMVLGGMDSCATWLSSPANKSAGHHWILGFWSGKNMEAALAGGDVGRVGKTTDGAGIVAEVELYCRTQPSRTVLVATHDTYERFKAEGR